MDSAAATAIDLRTVVVPLDGSSYAERAVEPAKWLAARIGVSVGIAHVVRTRDSADPDYLARTLDERGLEWLEVVEAEDVAQAIADVAASQRALVCMATHGHGRAQALVGSVAARVLADATEPIVLVGRGVGVTRLHRLERVVVALDGSEGSESVCDPAVAFARRFGLDVELVTVASEPLATMSPEDPPRRSFGLREPETYIDAVARRYHAPDVRVVGRAITDPISPASALEHLLRDPPGALVAMATRGRTGMQRLLHGSGAGTILDNSPVPALMFAIRSAPPSAP
jgi:nucleotide-binding universal stress UspA family protein